MIFLWEILVTFIRWEAMFHVHWADMQIVDLGILLIDFKTVRSGPLSYPL
jgi:hypothetical protein